MATTTLTVHQRAVRSSVTTKVIMAVTGICLIGFLLMHMFGNFKLLLPDDGAEFNEYSHYLRHFLYPVFPPFTFLWLFRLFLIACIVLHIWSAIKLAHTKRASVGTNRYATTKRLEKSYAARTMIWGGVIIVAFVIFHLLQFTAQVIRLGYPGGATSLEPYDRVIAGFSVWWVVAFYAVAMAAVCMHIWHGFWSAFATLGANVSAGARTVLKGLAGLIAIALFVGFMVPPILVFAGVLH